MSNRECSALPGEELVKTRVAPGELPLTVTPAKFVVVIYNIFILVFGIVTILIYQTHTIGPDSKEPAASQRVLSIMAGLSM